MNKIIKPSGVIVLFGSEPFSSTLRISNIANFKYDWIWEKNISTNFLHAKRQPLRKYEIISVFYDKPGSYYPVKTQGHKPAQSAKGKSKGNLWYGDNVRDYEGGDTSRFPINIIRIDSETTKTEYTQHRNQ